MNKHSILFSLVICVLVIGCENNDKTKNDHTSDSTPQRSNTKPEDSTVLKSSNAKSDSAIERVTIQSVFNGSKLKTSDYIQQYPENQKAELRSYIEWLRSEWKNVPNPITATYQGNDFGDYHHVIFKAANGVAYDFGQANNNYGKYRLYEDSEQLDDNPKFLGKKFKVYWDWKLSEFSCCDGEYGEAKAYLPAITKLELIEN